ncbi:MerR family DNA-binding transcriptional regulator, partial [Myxococcaceae bacterium JPH2]|nr:MerR family DNA-binding transcriptional regulator [Myxococcaceae bacterium JPH2]
MSEPIRIGQLASRTGRSVHTIRWDEAQGLMPGVSRDAGGQRTRPDLGVEELSE